MTFNSKLLYLEKERIRDRKLNVTPLLYLFVLLFFISPCKVRNFIQAEIGLQQTKVLHKSQTTVSQSSCSPLALFKTDGNSLTTPLLKSKFIITQGIHFKLVGNLAFPLCDIFTSSSPLVFDIPLYLLYQNLLIYF